MDVLPEDSCGAGNGETACWFALRLKIGMMERNDEGVGAVASYASGPVGWNGGTKAKGGAMGDPGMPGLGWGNRSQEAKRRASGDQRDNACKARLQGVWGNKIEIGVCSNGKG